MGMQQSMIPQSECRVKWVMEGFPVPPYGKSLRVHTESPENLFYEFR